MSLVARSRTAKGAIILMIASIAVVGLTACSNSGGPQSSPTATEPATTGPSSNSSSSATLAPTARPIIGTPIPLDCNGLVPVKTVTNFSPDFVLTTDYTPKAGSQAATIVKEKGLACSWVNQSTGHTIEVAVAHLPDDNLTDLKNGLVQSSNPVPTYGDEAYFQVVKPIGTTPIGTAEVFSGPFWIVAKSQEFYEPGDATPLVNAAIKSLGR